MTTENENVADTAAIAVAPAQAEPGLCIDALARLPAQAMIDGVRLAAILGRHPKTVRLMELRGELPPGVRFGRCRVWIVGRLIEYLNAAAERAEREAERRAEKIRQVSA